MELSPETIKAKIADLTAKRDKFLHDINTSPFMISANLEIAHYDGAIKALEQLTEEPKAAEAPPETEPAAKTQ